MEDFRIPSYSFAWFSKNGFPFFLVPNGEAMMAEGCGIHLWYCVFFDDSRFPVPDHGRDPVRDWDVDGGKGFIKIFFLSVFLPFLLPLPFALFPGFPFLGLPFPDGCLKGFSSGEGKVCGGGGVGKYPGFLQRRSQRRAFSVRASHCNVTLASGQASRALQRTAQENVNREFIMAFRGSSEGRLRGGLHQRRLQEGEGFQRAVKEEG